MDHQIKELTASGMKPDEIIKDGGSFRDPRGSVYNYDGRILRSINPSAQMDYHKLVESGLYDYLVENRWLTTATLIKTRNERTGILMVEHEKLPFVSYPYEWTFSQLKAAALLQLDIHLVALRYGFTLTDASSYNVQFIDSNPIFIDLLSFRKYDEGMLWDGHRQFCEQYLHPLIFTATFGIPFNSWLRGNLEGINAKMLLSLLPLGRKLSPRIFFNITLPYWLQDNFSQKDITIERASNTSLPKAGLEFMLSSLRNWIASVTPKSYETEWGSYTIDGHNYSVDEAQAKHRIVKEFITRYSPKIVWDMGCNSGEMAETALAAGAERVIGFDFDPIALESANRRARAKKLAFLPLFQDASNPSPNQGWANQERKSLMARRNADAMIALAFEHHLVIGRNIPIGQLVAWLVSLAPIGIIEFVPKGDSNLDRLLRNREDIFEEYTEKNFRIAIESVAQVHRVDTISASGRSLYWYTREK